MDLDMEPQTLVFTGIFYTLILLMIWKMSVSGLTTFYKIIFSVTMLPITFFIFKFKEGR